MSCGGWKWVCSWSVPLVDTLVKDLLRNNIPEGCELVNSDAKNYFFCKGLQIALKEFTYQF